METERPHWHAIRVNVVGMIVRVELLTSTTGATVTQVKHIDGDFRLSWNRGIFTSLLQTELRREFQISRSHIVFTTDALDDIDQILSLSRGAAVRRTSGTDAPPLFVAKLIAWIPGKYAEDAANDILEGYERRLNKPCGDLSPDQVKRAADRWAMSRAAESLIHLAWRAFITFEAVRKIIGL